MANLFAFDIGTNSIGWCVLALDAYDQPYRIVDAGVRIFSDGREPKSGTSLAEGRRMARGMSRRRDRYKRRRKAVLRTLIEYGLMPGNKQAQQALVAETSDRGFDQVAQDVYALRARALTEKLPPHHLGRALFHLNQRRGFKSNRKTDKRSNEKGAIDLGVDRLKTAMANAKTPTLGAFLAGRRGSDPGQWGQVRVRGGAPGAASDDEAAPRNQTVYDFYPNRQMLEDEFAAIWEAQRIHHPELLTEERREHLFTVMFYQRPLKPQVPGKCSFPPHLDERLPKAHPLFQAFRLYKEVNELEIVWPSDQSHHKLTLEQRDRLIAQLKTQRTATYKSLRSTLKLKIQGTRFNKESESRKAMAGDEVAAALSDKTCFGQRWFSLPLDVQWSIVQALRDEENPDALVDWLHSEHGLSRDAAKAVADAKLPDGYGRLGHTALSSMLDYLKEAVIPESKAAERAGYNHALPHTGDGLDFLPNYQEVLERRIPPGSGNPDDPYDVEMGRITNPTVHIGLNQLRRLVNGLIARYGKPERIALELARELNQSEDQKKAINKEIAKNTRDAEGRSAKLQELKHRDNGHNRMLLKLWEELNPTQPIDRKCIYCGEPILISEVFSPGQIDVDHILPWAQSLDDSQANRILCHARCNREKGNNAPADVALWSARYDEILERANCLRPNKSWRFARDAMAQFEKKRDFLDRQLTDTQYLARLAHDYLGARYADEEPDADGELFRRNHVIVVTGKMTEMLRRAWHLNDILHDHNYAETAKGKNRKDHRHHAIDAAVIGVTTRSMLQKIAHAAGQGEAVGSAEALRKIALPWDSFREDLRDKINAIIVSHKPDQGTLPGASGVLGPTVGRLHMDTAYGILDAPLANGDNVVRRKMLASLTDKDLDAIRDADLRALLVAATHGRSGAAFTQALLDFARGKRPHADHPYLGIRHVRVTEKLAVIPIKDAAGKIYKGYKGGANYRYDVWELLNGDWKVDVVSMYDAHQPGWISPMLARDEAGRMINHNARKVMSLQQNDMVAYELASGERVIARVRKFGQNAQIWFDAHNETGKLDDRHKDKADPFVDFSKTAGGLKAIKLRQVRIDEIGRLFDPGPQDQENRLERKNNPVN